VVQHQDQEAHRHKCRGDQVITIGKDSNKEKRAKEKTQELLNLFSFFESYRQQWDERAVTWYKQFVGYKEEREDGRSNLHIPRTYQIVDTIRARMMDSLFKTRPYIEFDPLPAFQAPTAMQATEEKARIGSGLLDEQLEKNNIIAKWYDYLTSGLVFPKGVLGVGWRYEEQYMRRKVPEPEIIQTAYGPQYTGNYNNQFQEGREVIWDDNEIVNVDYFDFWPDPKGYDLDSCRGVFQREFITREDLIQRLNFLHDLGNGEIYLESTNELDEMADAENLERGRERRQAEVNISDHMLNTFSSSRDNQMKKNTEFELLHYWEDNRHAIIVNRTKCIYDGPSPYWRHGKKPFVAFSFDRLPNEFYGLSAVQIISDLQEEENTIHNQRTDNVNFVLNKMWKVRRNADIDESQLVSRPHGVIYVDRADDVQELETKDVAASGFRNQNIVSTVMENALAAPPIMQGAQATKSQTATETMKQTGNAGLRFDVKVQLFADTDIKRLAYMMDKNNQQFINGRRLIKLGEEDGRKWRSITPGDLVGEYDYRPSTANIDPSTNKEVRREQLSHMIQMLMQMGVPFIEYHELVKEWLASFDIKNTEKFMIPKEVWQQQQAAMAAQQQQEQQQEGPQRGPGRPTEAQQVENAATGRARGRRPQEQRRPYTRPSGEVR